MESTAVALAGATAFARAMRPELPVVEDGLLTLRKLLAQAEIPYAFVGDDRKYWVFRKSCG